MPHYDELTHFRLLSLAAKGGIPSFLVYFFLYIKPKDRERFLSFFPVASSVPVVTSAKNVTKFLACKCLSVSKNISKLVTDINIFTDGCKAMKYSWSPSSWSGIFCYSWVHVNLRHTSNLWILVLTCALTLSCSWTEMQYRSLVSYSLEAIHFFLQVLW